MDSADIGRRIAQARNTKGLTQAQLAKTLGMDRATLAQLEAGEHRLSALDLVDLAQALDRGISWLLSIPSDDIAAHRAARRHNSDLEYHLELLEGNTAFVCRLGLLEAPRRPRRFARPIMPEAAEVLGHETRELAGLGDRPVGDIVATCEGLGLLVSSRELGDDADAASIFGSGIGVGLVNSSRPPANRRMAAAHLLMHHLVGDRYQPDCRIDADDRHAKRLDQAARAFLLPTKPLTDDWHLAADNVHLAALRLAAKYGVDPATLGRRLIETHIAPEPVAQQVAALRLYRSNVVEHGLEVPRDLEATTYPRSYARAVIRAYQAEEITLSRAVDLLSGSFSEDDFAPRSS